jgi:hypothetical protein
MGLSGAGGFPVHFLGRSAPKGDRRKEAVMDWVRILAYVTGTVDQELLARNEYLSTENRIRRIPWQVART